MKENGFLSKKDWLLWLLKLEVPNLVIQETLAISSVTLKRYIKLLKSTGEFTGDDESENGWQNALEIFAWAKETLSTRLDFLPKELLVKLTEALGLCLKEKEIILNIEHSLPAILGSLREPQEDDLIKYQILLENAYNNRYSSYLRNADLHEIACDSWYNFLSGFLFKKAESLSNDKFCWEGNHFVRDIILEISDKVKRIPIVDTYTSYLLIDIVNSMSEENKQLLVLHYGLNGTQAETLRSIAKKLGKALRKIENLHDKALFELKEEIVFPSWENTYFVKKNRGEYKVNFLKKKISELGVPEKITRILEGAGITYVYELDQINRQDLLKIPGIGTKYRTTIEECYYQEYYREPNSRK